MGKFDGILLCTDLDDTLLTSDKRVSGKNAGAIEYFKSEGGLFTFGTGRVPHGARLMLEYVRPNAPIVSFNGGVIYDFDKNEILWSRPLDSEAKEVVEFIDKSFPAAGVEVCTADTVYFCKVNELTEQHKVMEKFDDNYADYHGVKDSWNKVIFMVTVEEMPSLKQLIASSPFADRYTFVQSSPWYYELLPKGSHKGSGLLKLAELMKIDRSNIIAVGDNENDIEMIKSAGVGIAVANAAEAIKKAADYITVHHNNHAIAAVIKDLESGKLIRI